MKFSGLILCGALALSLVAQPATAVTREESTIQSAMVVLRELQAMPDQQIPDALLSRAEGIVILPGHVKVSLIFGGSGGRGVMLVRNADRSWSSPVFVSSGGVSWGLQAGGQVSDIVLVLTTRNSIEGIADGKLTLGADASVAAGPVGRTAVASTSLTFDSEIYAYSRTQGIFAGISLEGKNLFIGKKANRHFYDGEDSASVIFARTEAPPAPAGDLVTEVTRLTTATAQSVAVDSAEPREPASERPVEPRTYPMADDQPGEEPR